MDIKQEISNPSRNVPKLKLSSSNSMRLDFPIFDGAGGGI